MVLGRSEKLRTIFIKYIIALGVLVILLFALNFFLGPTAQIGVYPANYSENIIKKNMEELKSSPRITMDLLTPLCSFGVYSTGGDYLYGNFSTKEIDEVWDNYQRGVNSVGLSKYIMDVKRDEGILLVTYPLTMQYKSPKARSVLPNPELTMILLFFLELIAVIIIWSSRLSKKINRELNTLLFAAEKIEKQNLDFDMGKSRIQEIDRVLQGINDMKNALRISLEKQWLVEKQRQEQISALAHDVKTPLTIVKGNIELMQETEMTEEQRAYCNYIYESSRQMDGYIQALLAVSKKEAVNETSESFKALDFLNVLKEQAKALSSTKNIELLWETNIPEEAFLTGNENELIRALMNIVSNAVDFSPEDSSITFKSEAYYTQLYITIKDSGKGFSDKMLKYGKQQLSMGEESRTQKGHHGMGLYIADIIIKKHYGELILDNSTAGSGMVTVILLLQQNKSF